MHGGRYYIEHRNMAWGEGATELLAEYGLAVDDGYGLYLTQAGADLLNAPDIL